MCTAKQEKEIIELYNHMGITISQIGQKVNLSMGIVKGKIKSLQNKGILGKKNTGGKFVTEPVKKQSKKTKKKSSSPEASLASLLSDVKTETSKSEMSVYHKEMLIEILHKLI